jgi:hypothetical protein
VKLWELLAAVNVRGPLVVVCANQKLKLQLAVLPAVSVYESPTVVVNVAVVDPLATTPPVLLIVTG